MLTPNLQGAYFEIIFKLSHRKPLSVHGDPVEDYTMTAPWALLTCMDIHLTLTSIHRQLGSPFSLTAHSLPAPQNTLAHTLLLLCSSCEKRKTHVLRNNVCFYWFHTQGGTAALISMTI